MADLPSLHEVRALLADKQEYMAAVQAAARAASDARRRRPCNDDRVVAARHRLFKLYVAEVAHAIRCTAEASCDEAERPFAHGFALYDDCFPARRSLNRSCASRQLRAARSAVVDQLAADLRTALLAAGFAVRVHGPVISYALRQQDLPH